MKINVQSGVTIIPEGETSVLVKLDKPVRLDKAIINHCGSSYGSTSPIRSACWAARLCLIDERTLEVKRTYCSSFFAEVSWQVIEILDGENTEPTEEEKTKKKVVDWSKVPVDTPVLCYWDNRRLDANRRHFAYFDERVGSVYCWDIGLTSWSTNLTGTWDMNLVELAREEDKEKYMVEVEI